MKASPQAYTIIKEFEGLRLKAYKCPGGVWTIGYGHTEGITAGISITEDQAEEILRQDIETIETQINTLNLSLTQNQFDALVSFVFNLGIGNFRKSRLLSLIKADPYDNAIMDEFLKWVYSGGRVLPGLQRRRLSEMKLYFKTS